MPKMIKLMSVLHQIFFFKATIKLEAIKFNSLLFKKN